MLFDVVPENFFSPLASPGKVVYWECILRVYSVTSKQLSFGVERDVLVDELQYYFDSAMSADIPEEDREEGSGQHSSRDKANFVLRKLEATGWIYTDVDHSYIQRVNFRDYAIQVIRTLINVSEAQKVEYQGFIYTIYSLVRVDTNPGYGLMEIVHQTDELMTALKNLNSNIKTYIDTLTKHSTVSEILDALLNDYYTNIVDKAYHRLLTSDNVAKFRPEIIKRMERNSRSEKYLSEASREVAERNECSLEEAREQVLTMIHEVVDAFHSMDAVLNEINEKNTKYQRAAINRARFLLTSSADLRGQLKNILGYLNTRMTEEKLDPAGIYELEGMDDLIKIFSLDYLDIDSLYAPIEGKKEFVSEPMTVRRVDEKERRKKREEMLAKLENILNVKRIEEYVRMVMQSRNRMKASEFPLDDDGFIRLIYICLYGQRKTMHYRLELLDTVEVKGYRFRDFWIVMKN